MVTRLQLGTSRLEELDVKVLERFLDPSWLHLGDAESERPARNLAYYARLLRADPAKFARLAFSRVFGRTPRVERPAGEPEALYARTNFQEFLYAQGEKLPCDDESIHYIFSEHFFNHLFFDDASALLRECRRVLKPFGVIRSVVPDADLRTYEPPEPAGFPDGNLSFLAPLKHRTRWSVYMLEEALRQAGLEPIPLRYCDRFGRYVTRDPADLRGVYQPCPEKTMVFDLGHIRRIDSLIVDGVKLPTDEAGYDRLGLGVRASEPS